jgi:hypothetical protein
MVQRKFFQSGLSSTETTPTKPNNQRLAHGQNAKARRNGPSIPSQPTANQAPSAKTVPNQLDDLTIIRHFIQGDVALASNYQLHVQTTHNTHQLYTNKGQLIARARHNTNPAKISVRPLGEYSELLKKMFLEHEFMPLGLDASGHFVDYEYHPIPDGYALNLTSAQDFWKYWWRHLKFQTGFQQAPEVLAFLDGKWSIVQELVLQKRTLFITAGDSETALQDFDEVTWLQPQEDVVEADQTICYTSLPSQGELAQQGFTAPPKEPAPLGQAPQNHRDDKDDALPLKSSKSGPTPIGFVRRCSDNKLIIETPHGQVVVMGDRLNFFVNRSLNADIE